MPNNKAVIVKCPTCKKTQKYDSQNPFRPFCSERCQVIDAGAWADESYRVPGEPVYEDINPEDFDSDL